jgi:type II secretory pathway component HofQ
VSGLIVLAGAAVTVAFAAFSVSACRKGAPGGGSTGSTAPGAEDPQHAERVRDTYRPPADGRVTRAQVEAYERVLGAAVASIRAHPPQRSAGTSLGESETSPDVAAARRERIDPEEYLWVRERVLEAEASVATARLNADAVAILERTLAELRSRRSGAADEGSRKLLDEQVGIFGGEVERLRREAREPEPSSVRENVKLLEPRRARLEALEDEFRKLSAPPPSASASPTATGPPVPTGPSVPPPPAASAAPGPRR